MLSMPNTSQSRSPDSQRRKRTLAAIRTDLGLSQVRLANYIKEYAQVHHTTTVTPVQIARIELFKSNPVLKTRKGIVFALDDYMKKFSIDYRRNRLGLQDGDYLTDEMIQWEQEEQE